MDSDSRVELYLWPFSDAVRAGVGAVMCSYNQLNNTYACGNSKLMNGLLKDELDFQGFVMVRVPSSSSEHVHTLGYQQRIMVVYILI